MKTSAINIRLGGLSWYNRYLISQKIYQEAGMKENFLGGILGAVILILAGCSIKEASRRTNTPETQIEDALQDEAIMNNAKLQMEEMEEKIEKPERKTEINTDSFLNEAFDYIGRNEGLELEEYNDTKGYPTIGIGHKIKEGEDFSNGITIEDAKNLFAQDIQEHLEIARGLFPYFDSYPNYVKVALLDGVFRGDHRKSYRTTKLINQGDWVEASKEYLRNNDYYNSLNEGTGVAGRMKENSQKMNQYGKEISKWNTSTS